MWTILIEQLSGKLLKRRQSMRHLTFAALYLVPLLLLSMAFCAYTGSSAGVVLPAVLFFMFGGSSLIVSRTRSQGLPDESADGSSPDD